ncbi:MAG: aminotransferase class V-fold PLP-dependent enzyme, partial [Candidatus Parcubacteria bacterium]|nr:aminotransferase class V-fold PLP-dependent enzyme [Candidatus Parcubacteria bacterium]
MAKSNKETMKNKAKSIYLDYMASVLANPSSIHQLGLEAKSKLQGARKKVAEVLNARMEEIIFTSGGTESNNLAIQGIVLSCSGKFLPHIITTNIEHPSVLKTFEMLRERKLAEVSIVPVEKNGIVDPKKIKKEIKKNTILVSVMYANNEIGTIQPIKEIAKEIRHYKKNLTPSPLSFTPSVTSPLQKGEVGERCIFPVFHTDAVQAVNYLDLNVEMLGADLLSLSGSKIEGAGRVGVLYKKKGVTLAPLFGGGDQEQGLRPGTENLLEIIKFANALGEIQKIKNIEIKRLTKLQNYFLAKLQHSDILKNVRMLINGDLENRLP